MREISTEREMEIKKERGIVGRGEKKEGVRERGIEREREINCFNLNYCIH